MRQQARGTAAGGPRARRRVLTLLLGGGALVAVWWFLMTGTAHAAESPVPHGPVKALQQKAKPVADAKERVKAQVAHRVEAKVSRAVERTDRTADRAVAQVEQTLQKTADTAGPVVGAVLVKTKQTVKATASLGTTSHVVRERAAERQHLSDVDFSGSTDADRSGSFTVPAADSGSSAGSTATPRSLVLDHHRAPKPTRTDADGSSGGPIGLALPQQSDPLMPPALLGTPVDSGHLRPAELAYPPGSSPD